MAVAGYNSKLFASGASTAFSAEPTTQIGATKSYQINTAAKRVLDPATVPTVKISGVAVALANIASIDPYFGIVTFVAAYTPAAAPTVDGAYLPLLAVANLRELTASLKCDVLDLTVMGVANKQKGYGLGDASGDLMGLDPLVVDLDTGTVGRQSLWDFFQGRTPKLLQYDFDGSNTYVLRLWVVFQTVDAKTSVAQLMTSKVTWEQALQAAFNAWGVAGVEFSFGAP